MIKIVVFLIILNLGNQYPYEEIKENEFYPFIENNDNVLIFFWIKNCGHSNELLKKLEEFKTKYSENKNKILPIRIYDCNKGVLCSKLKIWSNPSYKYYVKKFDISENYNINYQNLYKFIIKRSALKIYNLKNEDLLNNDLKIKKRNVIIINRNKLNYNEIKEIKLMSSLFNKFKIYYSNTKNEVLNNKLVIFKNNSKLIYKKDIINKDNLFFFFRKLFKKSYFYLNTDNMNKIIAYQKTSLILFCNGNDKKIIKEFKNFTNSFIKNEFNFIISKDWDTYESKFLRRNAGILIKQLPIIFIMKYENKEKKFTRYKMEDEINYINISKFYKKFLDNELSLHKKIGPIKDLELIKYKGVEVYDNKNLNFMIKYKSKFLCLIYDDLDENPESKKVFSKYKNFIKKLTKKIIKDYESQEIIFSLANINEYELDNYLLIHLPVLLFKLNKEVYILEYNSNVLKVITNYLLGDESYLEIIKSMDIK